MTILTAVELGGGAGSIRQAHPHVRRIVKQHIWWHVWHRVCQSAQLSLTVGEATADCKLADASVHKVFADLRLIVAVEHANAVATGEVLGQRIIYASFLSVPVSKTAHLAKRTLLVLLVVTTQSRFVLQPGGPLVASALNEGGLALLLGVRIRFTFLIFSLGGGRRGCDIGLRRRLL